MQSLSNPALLMISSCAAHMCMTKKPEHTQLENKPCSVKLPIGYSRHARCCST